MKKVFLEFIQILAFSIFIGIAVYGAIIYWGGETNEKIPASSSLLLGLGAVICIIVIVIIGGFLDRMASSSEEGSK
jgi:hypothetical protein